MAQKEVKKITLSGVLSWIFGIIFALAGLGAFTSSSFFAGFAMLIMGAVLLPPMNKLFKEKMNFELSTGIKIAVIIICFVVVGMTMNTDTTSTTTDNSQVVTNNQVNTPVETQKEMQVKEPETPKETTTSTTMPVVEEKIDTATMGEKNALKKALSYLDYTAFSYKGLIKQLEFEGFSHEEAVYGADNCGADWNEQAALKAQSYLDYTAFSRDGLIKQLEYEGFTREQAEYGADAVGY